MPVQVINGVGIAGIGTGSSSQSGGGSSSSFDTDAQAFITAASITATTQQNAVNDLVLDLKAASLWTKMKALYPMVGGTSLSHKWNLKDPRDLDAAYRLVFNGGWTHTASGATPNGTTGYANTNFIPNTNLNIDSTHLSFYSRTSQANALICEFGCSDNANELPSFVMYIKYNDGNYKGLSPDYNVTMVNVANSDSKGFYIDSRTANNSHKAYKNGAIFGTNTAIRVQTTLPTRFIPLSAYHYIGSPPGSNLITGYSAKQCAFASIGDGLTDLESNLFYQIVEKFQYALGRNINATQPFYFNRNYSLETNAFVFNGGITDATQISATNTLVNTLKTAGIWSKMKAVYPMVGGTATSHKLNLVNPVDATSAYALTFAGGWTHSSTGALPNGTTAYADTSLNSSTQLTLNNTHLSFYSRSNVPGGVYVEIGNYNGVSVINLRPTVAFAIGGPSSTSYNSTTNSTGFWSTSRTSNTVLKGYRNGIVDATSTSLMSTTYANLNLFISARNESGTPLYFSSKECAFASIGDGLTDAESNTLTDAVQAFQTTLGRQV